MERDFDMPSQWRIGFALTRATSTNKELYTTYIRLSVIFAELAVLKKIAVEANWHDVCDALGGDLSQSTCCLVQSPPI